jgi:hypothetical protein
VASDGWISVKDRLPEPGVSVLVVTGFEKPIRITIGWTFTEPQEARGKWGSFAGMRSAVLYWMPLPGAPDAD